MWYLVCPQLLCQYFSLGYINEQHEPDVSEKPMVNFIIQIQTL